MISQQIISFVSPSPLLTSSTSFSTSFTRCKSRRLHRNFVVTNSRPNIQIQLCASKNTAASPSDAYPTTIDSTKRNLVKFPSLRPDTFRHPVDVRASRFMKTFIGLETTLRIILRTVEQSLFFENLATGIKVTCNQYPSIHKMLTESCTILDLPTPQLYIRQNPTPNAYTLAMQGNQPFIVIHSSLIELLTPKELQAVIAHELGHLKSEHGVFITMANLLLLMLPLPEPIVENLNLRLLSWRRAAELSCDRAMLLVTQDCGVALSALVKLTGGMVKYSGELNVDEFIKQADMFDKISNDSWFGRRVRDSMINSTTHPLPILRVRELKRWSESNHFRSLIQSGIPFEEKKDSTK